MEEKRKTEELSERKGVSLHRLNAVMTVLACVLSVVLLYAAYRTTGSYAAVRESTERYITCQQAADSMQAASDYLTEQVRVFVVTGDPECVSNFVNEIEVTRRRDAALDDLGTYFSGTAAYSFLENALQRSNELAETEKYAMRLVIAASGDDPSDYPEGVAQIELSEDDAALPAEDMRQLAVELVFGEEYKLQKSEIGADVSQCLDTLITETKARQTGSSDRLQTLLRGQTGLIVVLLIIVFAVVFMTSRLVIRPLSQAIADIRNHEMLLMRGSSELQFLAETYNTMYEQTRRDQDQLSYEATHDVLTGLYNRTMFEKLRAASDPGQIAMILIDVDKFKGINDTYGHDVGDRILQKAASLLQASFRSEDCVCRIGGDEFVVIMQHAGSALTELVRGKIAAVNHAMAHPEDDLPAATLSVGVAFGDREDPTDDIYKDADTALYKVKNAGRSGCEFY